MSAADTLIRRSAKAIMLHVLRVMPNERSAWAQAMQQEIDHIVNDRSALGWAIGCLLIGYSERMQAINILRTSYVRSILALMIIFEAWQALFEPIMVLSYRLQDIGIMKALGGFTPGDDYGRFIPLMDTTPSWLECFGIASGILYLTSAWKLMRGRKETFVFFALAMVLGLLGSVIGNFVPGLAETHRTAFAFAHTNLRRDVLIPVAGILLPAFIAIVLWWIVRPQLESSPDGHD